MKVSNCGYDYRHAPDFKIIRPNGSGDYMLLIIRSDAYFILDGEKKDVKKNSVILMKKGTPQIYGAAGNEFVNDWVHFDMDEEDIRYTEKTGMEFNRIIPVDSVSELSEIIIKMCKERYSNAPNSGEAANMYLRLLILKTADFKSVASDKCNISIYERFSGLRSEIYSNPQKKRTPESVAKEFSMSVSGFQHQYKKFFGNGLKKDITLSRIEYAKYLLFSTMYTVSKISSLCGYENDVHFMRIFKSYTGITPGEYRNKVAVFPVVAKNIKRSSNP